MVIKIVFNKIEFAKWQRRNIICGICGFIDDDGVPLSHCLNMLSKIRHRGPDQVGVFLDGSIDVGRNVKDLEIAQSSGSICLAQARLEIVGGREGVQPIKGEVLTLVHNGEIYNHIVLRKLLQHKDMGSESDSEILLHLIEEYYDGDLLEALKKGMPLLDGMYAIAVTDGKSLALARDAFNKGYDVIMLSDCVASREENLHKASLTQIKEAYGWVMTSDELINKIDNQELILSGVETPPVSLVTPEAQP